MYRNFTTTIATDLLKIRTIDDNERQLQKFSLPNKRTVCKGAENIYLRPKIQKMFPKKIKQQMNSTNLNSLTPDVH